MSKISVAIPTYDANGAGAGFLEQSFRRFVDQTFNDFEIVVSDNSDGTDNIKNVCKNWENTLDIRYVEHLGNKKSPSENTNNAIKNCNGEIIKVLCGDDFLYDENSLKNIVDNFDPDEMWFFTSYVHSTNMSDFYRYYVPFMNSRIYMVNTLGTPSALSLRRSCFDKIPWDLFDKNMRFCYDCDAYYRLYLAFGNPKVINDIGMVNYIHGESITNNIMDEEIKKEEQYILRKYGFIE